MTYKRVLAYVLIGMCWLVLFGLCLTATAQTIPSRETVPAYESRDWYVWYEAYQKEHIRAEQLGDTGHDAIVGLQEELTAANESIVGQNKTIVSLGKEVDTQRSRADSLQTSLNACTANQPKTWAGRQLRKARNALSIVGGVAILAGVARLAVP